MRVMNDRQGLMLTHPVINLRQYETSYVCICIYLFDSVEVKTRVNKFSIL